MEISELSARLRKVAGKGYARRFRKDGLLPAVCYGPGKETMLLTVTAAALMNIRTKEENAFIKLIIENDEDQKKVERLSILKELQVEPVSRRYVHADFYEVAMDQEMTFDIPVHLTGEAPGIDRGGELNQVKRDVKVSCLPARRPEFIALDISGLGIGDSLKVKDIAPMPGVSILDQEDSVIVNVAAGRVVAGPAAEAGEAGTEEKGPSES